MKHIVIIFLSVFSIRSNAQESKDDSTKVVNTFRQLLSICKNANLSDNQSFNKGPFAKAAKYFIYRGDDKKRAWKEFSNYNNAEDRENIDKACFRINRTINQASTYKIIKYFTKTESEGKWHAIVVSYKKNGKDKEALFAFLKIGSRFGLGDID